MTLRASVLVLALLTGAVAAEAQQASDPRVADLLRAGTLRVALFPPQVRKDPATGETRRGALFMELARGLATRIGVELRLIDYPTPVAAIDALKTGACDLAFLAIDPARAQDVDFSSPFTQFDFTFLGPAGSPIVTAADADRPGVRIAIVHNHGSALALARVVKHARLVSADNPEAAFELLRTGSADAMAAPRVGLLRFVGRLPGSRVLGDRYGGVSNAVAIAKDQPGRLAYISEFIEEVKASGLVQRAIGGGEDGVQVAPPASPPRPK